MVTTDDLPALSGSTGGAGEHVVQFYEAESALLDRLEGFVAGALSGDGAAIVIATEAHREALHSRLQAAGIDLDAAVASGAYVNLDAAEVLTRFMVDAVPDPARFVATILPVIEGAGVGGRPVRAFGEMVALLVEAGHPEAAIALEGLWSELQRRLPFDLFCAYSMDVLGSEEHDGLVGAVCGTHDRVLPGESYADLADSESRSRMVAELQQRARRLETEVAARQHAERALVRSLAAEQEARQAAEAALRLREEFIAIAAHELKTPLTTVLGNVQLVARRLARREGPAVPGADRALSEAIGSVKRLALLVAQMLDMSRSDAGKLPLSIERADLVPLVLNVVAAANDRDATHPLTVTGLESAVVPHDPVRLEQVLTNLIDNAIKFSPHGSPVLVEVLRSTREGLPWVEVAVQDRGQGVPADQRTRIFDRFYQAESPVPRQGLGLGLYISRQVMEQHGGRLIAEFPDTGGSRFVLQLPAA